MSKKLISVMLALVMVLSVFSISVFAVNVGYEDPEAEEAYTQMWYLETANEPDANGDYTVDVYLEANYFVGAISFHVDAVGATLKDADASEFIYDADGYNAEVEVNKAKGNVYIVPKPTDATKNGLDVTSATHIATLTYTLTAETATITLVNDAKTIGYDGKLIATRLGDDVLSSNTMYYGQWVVDAEYVDVALGDPISEVTLGEEVAAADPVLSGVDGGYVDPDRMYVYGVPVGEDASAYFTVENGTFEITGNATGDTLTVYTEDGDVYEEYTLIIFGDVTCDGKVNMEDSGAVDDHVFGISLIEDDVVKFAADVTADSKINMEDSGAIDDHVYGISTIAGNVWAA